MPSVWLETINLRIVTSAVAGEIQAHHNTHSFHLAKEIQDRGDHPSPKSSVRLFPRSPPLTVFLFLLPADWSGQTCGFGHRKLWILHRMKDVFSGGGGAPPPLFPHPSLSSPDPTHSPPPKWHLTPWCVYIRPQKWEIVMSHSGCMFTLQSHARKEISHGLLKAARWERIAAVHQGCSDLARSGLRLFHVISAAESRRPAGRRWRCAGAGSSATARGECLHRKQLLSCDWDVEMIVDSRRWHFLHSGSSIETCWITASYRRDDFTFVRTIGL